VPVLTTKEQALQQASCPNRHNKRHPKPVPPIIHRQVLIPPRQADKDMFFPIVLSPAPKPDPASRLTKPAEGVDTSPHPATETEIPADEPACDTETVHWIDGQA